ncbi:MAG: trigger factor [Tannerellaceae bacterium]|jgi:trigger factor|nr:trigger factor [Tannerellaceae bacterium]
MNISFNNRDAASATLKIELTKEDYATKMDKTLRELRRDANIPGFRKGMVPIGIVRKKYGKSIIAKEINDLVSEALQNYISNNKIEIFGQPMPNENEQKEIDFETQEDFEFYFDLALVPQVEVDISDKDTLPYYQVIISDDMVDKRIESYQATFGTYDDTAEAVTEKDMIKGTVTELENGLPRKEGLLVEDAILIPMYIKNEEDKHTFMTAKKGDTLTFNPQRAFEGSEAEIASFLRINREEAPSITADFSFTIAEVTHYKEADLDQELYDKIFGKEVVTDEESFREKVRESLKEQYTPQSNYKFFTDARPFLLDKVAHITFADDILKRCMLDQNMFENDEHLNENYSQVLGDLKIKLIKDMIVSKYGFTVEEEEREAVARTMVHTQLAQYGMNYITDDLIADYAKDLLKDKKASDNITDRVKEDKFMNWLKNTVHLDVKEISPDEFVAILQSNEQKQPA